MKKTKIIFWIITVLMSIAMGIGAIFDAISSPEAVAYVTKLGYPLYIIPFLGVAKILGIIAILIPGYPRLKEWAYAGLIFDLTGAIYSHIGAGQPVSAWGFIFIPVLLVGASYIAYHKILEETKSADVRPIALSTR